MRLPVNVPTYLLALHVHGPVSLPPKIRLNAIHKVALIRLVNKQTKMKEKVVKFLQILYLC